MGWTVQQGNINYTSTRSNFNRIFSEPTSNWFAQLEWLPNPLHQTYSTLDSCKFELGAAVSKAKYKIIVQFLSYHGSVAHVHINDDIHCSNWHFFKLIYQRLHLLNSSQPENKCMPSPHQLKQCQVNIHADQLYGEMSRLYDERDRYDATPQTRANGDP